MDPAIRMLARAERLVMESEAEVARQWQIVNRLDRATIDSRPARDLLRQLENLRSQHRSSRERLRRKCCDSMK